MSLHLLKLTFMRTASSESLGLRPVSDAVRNTSQRDLEISVMNGPKLA